jgi:uncharacterized protein YceH (UPF0502 family)
MVEKAKTTPDVYPLSLNALVAGCNQKSNRDPVLNLSEEEVEEALASAQKKGLAIKITGGRVVRWRHHLYETFLLDKVGLAVVGELLLRGPQTEGELRSRASRMEPIEDLDALRAVLRPLAERRLVVYLSPPDRRGTVLTHGFHDLQELDRLRSTPFDSDIGISSTSAVASGSILMDRLGAAEAEIAELRSRITDLEGQITALADQVRGLLYRPAGSGEPS